MKTIIVPLIGDPIENLYQLGMREKASFLKIEDRVTRLLSTNMILRTGQDIISRARVLMKKKEDSFFDKCVTAYAEGMGIDPARYFSFLSLFELAAHYGQVYPELKGILPGCTSVFAKTKDGITHSRLLDFPLIGIFEENPRLYFWQQEGKLPLLNYSAEGLAPLFLQGLHGSGLSFALHHKPGKSYHRDGQSIFKITFETMFEAANLTEVKKEIRKKVSVTKWSLILLEKSGAVQAMDLDGPALNSESYHLNEVSPLIFTNIPLQQDVQGSDNFLKFSESRQNWMKEKLAHAKGEHILDLMTDVEDQKAKKWLHPAATLSTVGAYHINLTTGLLDVKEGQSAIVKSDEIIQFSLAQNGEGKVIKKATTLRPFEEAWKRASKAQSAFDQGEYDTAYHELQMAQVLMPNTMWKEIMSFYLCLWDFRFIGNSKELALIYKKVKKLNLPESLKDQWTLLIMRMEKRLDLAPTVTSNDVQPSYRELFQQEKLAPKPLFATWMKLLYPRLELLDVFSPHSK